MRRQLGIENLSGTPECITQRTLKISLPDFPLRATLNVLQREPYIFTDEGSSHLRLHPGSRWRKRRWVCVVVHHQIPSSVRRHQGPAAGVFTDAAEQPLAGRLGICLNQRWLPAFDSLMQVPRVGLLHWEQV